VDAGDADPATFFYYLGIAARKAAPRFRRPLPLLIPEYGPGIQTFSKRYFESLIGRLRQPYALVLDNFQEAPTDSMLHEIVSSGTSVIPPNRQVIVISRSAPPSSFVRLQANNQLVIVGWDKLRYTIEELAEVMCMQCAGPLPAETVRLVYEKTDGWAAGASLICQAVRMEALDPGAIKAPLSEKAFDYFSYELFRRAEPTIQDFLLRTVFVPSLTPKVAGQLSGRANAGQILSELNRRNFFIEKRSQPQPTYQYHPLFREFLLDRVGKTFSPETIASLQQRAGQMLEASGQVDDAVELYRESRDWQGMIRLILQSANALVTQGRSETLERWLLALPGDTFKAYPWLLYWRGICELFRDPVRARPHFIEAYALSKKLCDRTGTLLSWSGVVDTYLHQWDTLAPLKKWIRELQSLLRQQAEFPSPEIEIAVAVRMFNTLLYIRPQGSDLPAWQRKIAEFTEQSVDTNQRMLLSAFLLISYSFTGALDKMHALMRDLAARRLPLSELPLARIMWVAGTSLYHWIKSESTESLRLVGEALELSQKYDFHMTDARILAQGVYASLTAGHIESARNYLDGMRAALNPQQRMDAGQYHYAAAYYFAVAGDLDRSLEHALKAVAKMDEAGALFLIALGCCCLAQVRVLRGEFREATAPLSRARRIGWQMRSLNLKMHVHLLEAQIAHGQGDEKRMFRALRKGLIMGRETGFMGITWWLPSVMESLCLKALEHGLETEYVRELIRKRSFTPKTPPQHLERWPWPVKVFTFGRFSLLKDDTPIAFSGKAPQKPLGLLKALIALGGRDVPVHRLLDALWPDLEADAAYNAFTICMHRLRKLVGHEQIVHLAEEKVTLDQRSCWVDVWPYERKLTSAENAWLTLKDPDRAAALTEEIIHQNKGPFLPGDDTPWAIPVRERLNAKFSHCIRRLGSYYEKSDQPERAAACFRRAIDASPLSEDFYRKLMRCYHRLGRTGGIRETYRRCQNTLSTSAGIHPSKKTTALFQLLTRKHH
jgi:DNA-binding SARP family transcriptional activator